MNQRIKIIGGIIIVFLLGAVVLRISLFNMGESTSVGYSDNSRADFGIATAQVPLYAGEGKMMAVEESARDMYPPTPMPGGGVAPEAEKRLIIQTGNLSVVVKDVRAAVQSITALTAAKGGFVVSSYVSEEGLAPTAYVTIRIPAKEFNAGVAETKKLGEVKSEQVNGQDVTSEYVDLDAQLRNLRATETQFLAIMQKAVKIEDILAVQRELSNVRGQIEGIQGRMKYLSESADLSTLTINLSTDATALPVVDNSEQWKPLAVIKDAVRSLLDLGKGVVNAIIWLVVYIPVLAVIVLVVWLLYRWSSRLFKPKM